MHHFLRAGKALAAGAVATIALAYAPAAGAATTVSTLGSGTPGFSPFGVNATHTYGQTITPPAGAGSLTSFAFEMQVNPDVTFRGEVYRWDDTAGAVVGPALYESGPTNTTNGTDDIVTFNTGGIPVTPGQTYVIFATVDRDANSDTNGYSWSWTNGTDAYPGGKLVYFNDNSAADWTSSWDGANAYPGSDMAFTATFDGASGGLAVTGVSPASGTTAGGSVVTIVGSGFAPGDEVYFGDVRAASWVIDGPGRITAVTPAHAAGPVHVTVAQSDAVSQFSPGDVFTFVAPDQPATAPAPSPPTIAPAQPSKPKHHIKKSKKKKHHRKHKRHG